MYSSVKKVKQEIGIEYVISWYYTSQQWRVYIAQALDRFYDTHAHTHTQKLKPKHTFKLQNAVIEFKSLHIFRISNNIKWCLLKPH